VRRKEELGIVNVDEERIWKEGDKEEEVNGSGTGRSANRLPM